MYASTPKRSFAWDRAPAFSLKDQEGRAVTLSDFTGTKLLLYFYPKADTPGCTAQACSIQEAMPDLKSLGIAAVGVSPDLPDEQKKFAAKYGLAFPLLSDPDHAVAEAYGAWGEKSMYGKKYMGVVRSHWVIDENGVVVDEQVKISPADSIEQAVKFIIR